jgi:hypothetical protein
MKAPFAQRQIKKSKLGEIKVENNCHFWNVTYITYPRDGGHTDSPLRAVMRLSISLVSMS